MFRKILVPLDGTESAERMADWTVDFAASIGAEVTLLAVIDPEEMELPSAAPERDVTIPGQRPDQDLPGGHDTEGRVIGGQAMGAARQVWTPNEPGARPPEFGADMIDQAQEHARIYLQNESKRLERSGVRINKNVQVGDPAETIISQSSELGADLIAMATHRGSALARGILGSVTDRVLHSAPVPVLVVHPEDGATLRRGGKSPKTILAPVDGSERSEEGVSTALDIAESCGSEVVFLQSVDVPYYAVSGMEYSARAGDYGISGRRQGVTEELQRFTEKARERGVDAHAQVPVGNAAGQITQAAERLDDPLIVMTTRGASGIKRWVMGSVTDKVVRSSGKPVLVLRSQD